MYKVKLMTHFFLHKKMQQISALFLYEKNKINGGGKNNYVQNVCFNVVKFLQRNWRLFSKRWKYTRGKALQGLQMGCPMPKKLDLQIKMGRNGRAIKITYGIHKIFIYLFSVQKTMH